MSEYQYYEFQAIDRPLTEREMAELRGYSTRARITATSFVNDYAWGRFKGDEDVWMERYFDAFLYVANWGTHILKLRLPTRLLDARTARLYCVGEHASVREKAGRMVLTFRSEEEEEGGHWVEGEGLLASLIGVRAELARGDLRLLYLGWLLSAQTGDLDADDVEPPVPAGLARLSGSLESCVAFLRIDTDLVRASAAASPPLADKEVNPADVRDWLAGLPVTEKDDLLARLIVEDEGGLAAELVQRFRRRQRAEQGAAEAATETRTVAALLRGAEKNTAERRRAAARKAAREKARQEQEAALARARHLDDLAAREPAIWIQLERLVATGHPKRYDQAIELLADLRDLAARKGGAGFRERLEKLRAAHARKPAFLARLREAGL
jgi:hypothetical protein